MGLESLAEEIVSCTRCGLSATRLNVVVGAGDPDASVVFIGEAPGRNEDEQGMPFVGRAGKILEGLLDSIGLSRDEVYIANILKCRPPKNRNPTSEEIRACTPFLEGQLRCIRPSVICPLGNYATNFVLSFFDLPEEKIGAVHGKRFDAGDGVCVVPLYHPAATIYNRKLLSVLEDDFKNILR